MRLSPHFTTAEMTRSETAARHGIDNSVPEDLRPNLVDLVAMLERIRAFLGDHPIHITSGYRSPETNRRIGGARGSHHVSAAAADFVAPSAGAPLVICQRLAPKVDALGIGQLIAEYATPAGGGWVHVSVLPVLAPNRIISIDSQGVRIGIHPARR